MWETLGNVMAAGVSALTINVSLPPSEPPTNVWDFAEVAAVTGGVIIGVKMTLDWLDKDAPLSEPQSHDGADTDWFTATKTFLHL